MLKNALSNGHSSQVRGWLLIDGVKHELAQVGPDFLSFASRFPETSFAVTLKPT